MVRLYAGSQGHPSATASRIIAIACERFPPVQRIEDRPARHAQVEGSSGRPTNSSFPEKPTYNPRVKIILLVPIPMIAVVPRWLNRGSGEEPRPPPRDNASTGLPEQQPVADSTGRCNGFCEIAQPVCRGLVCHTQHIGIYARALRLDVQESSRERTYLRDVTSLTSDHCDIARATFAYVTAHWRALPRGTAARRKCAERRCSPEHGTQVIPCVSLRRLEDEVVCGPMRWRANRHFTATTLTDMAYCCWIVNLFSTDLTPATPFAASLALSI